VLEGELPPFVDGILGKPMRARNTTNKNPSGRSVKVGPKKPTVQERAGL